MSALGLEPAAITGWMIFSLLIGGIVILAALAAHDAQRAGNRTVRWIWFGAILGIVALSAAAPARRLVSAPRVIRGMPLTELTSTVAVRKTPAGPMYWMSSIRTAVTQPIVRVQQAGQKLLTQLPVSTHRLLGLTWLFASLGTLGIFATSYWRIRRTMQTWPREEIAGTTARIAPAAGPAVVGLAPSEIILPQWLLQCPPAEQQLVVTHETEHVRAHDPWLLVMACGATALMPWNPALWFALGRLRLAVELDCDQRVLRRGVPAEAYGSLLIDLSALRSTLPSAMPAFSCNGSYLERRLVAMTSRPSRFAGSRRFIGGMIAAVALVTACESKLPTSAEVEEMDVAAAERAFVTKLDGKKYVVDGKAVTEEEAKSLNATRIAAVEVAGSKLGLAEIRITTRQAAELRKSSGEVIEKPITEKPITVTGYPLDSSEVARRRAVEAGQKVEGILVRTRGELELGAAKEPKVLLRSDSPKRKFDGLLVVDGVISNSTDLQSLNPDMIKSIEVVKGSAATTRYTDPRAANGVIVVTMKPKN